MSVLSKQWKRERRDVKRPSALRSVPVLQTRGIAGPKGMPEPIVSKLRDVLKKAMEDPEHVSKLESQGLAIKIMVGEEYAKYFAE